MGSIHEVLLFPPGIDPTDIANSKEMQGRVFEMSSPDHRSFEVAEICDDCSENSTSITKQLKAVEAQMRMIYSVPEEGVVGNRWRNSTFTRVAWVLREILIHQGSTKVYGHEFLAIFVPQFHVSDRKLKSTDGIFISILPLQFHENPQGASLGTVFFAKRTREFILDYLDQTKSALLGDRLAVGTHPSDAEMFWGIWRILRYQARAESFYRDILSIRVATNATFRLGATENKTESHFANDHQLLFLTEDPPTFPELYTYLEAKKRAIARTADNIKVALRNHTSTELDQDLKDRPVGKQFMQYLELATDDDPLQRPSEFFQCAQRLAYTIWKGIPEIGYGSYRKHRAGDALIINNPLIWDNNSCWTDSIMNIFMVSSRVLSLLQGISLSDVGIMWQVLKTIQKNMVVDASDDQVGLELNKSKNGFIKDIHKGNRTRVGDFGSPGDFIHHLEQMVSRSIDIPSSEEEVAAFGGPDEINASRIKCKLTQEGLTDIIRTFNIRYLDLYDHPDFPPGQNARIETNLEAGPMDIKTPHFIVSTFCELDPDDGKTFTCTTPQNDMNAGVHMIESNPPDHPIARQAPLRRKFYSPLPEVLLVENPCRQSGRKNAKSPRIEITLTAEDGPAESYRLLGAVCICGDHFRTLMHASDGWSWIDAKEDAPKYHQVQWDGAKLELPDTLDDIPEYLFYERIQDE